MSYTVDRDGKMMSGDEVVDTLRQLEADNARLREAVLAADAHINAVDAWWGWLKEPKFPSDPDGSIEAQYRIDKKLVEDTHEAYKRARDQLDTDQVARGAS